MDQINLFDIFDNNAENNEQLNFIDLFAGIGGFHHALNKLNMNCVFASEIDVAARQTYLNNHKISEEIFNADIRSVSPFEIPHHDILCAGFPCQPFSQAGHKKGFKDGAKSERGNLFFCILDILEAKRPKAFILENVRHLLNHDNGNTFSQIKEYLTEINYSVDYKILKASEFGIPQHRPRIFIVGFDKEQINTSIPFEFPAPIPLKKTMSDIWGGECDRKIGFTLRVGGRGSDINDRRNWDSYRVDGQVKRLGPTEGKKLMGYPESFILHPTYTQAMKQLGNSVCPDVVYHVAKKVKQYLISNIKQKDTNMPDFSFNKGEWSEVYAFLKLLIDNKLSFGSADGNIINDDYVTVIKLKHNNNNFDYNVSEGVIEIFTPQQELVNSIPLSELLSNGVLTNLLNSIRAARGASFQLPNITATLESLMVSNFKGSSSSKGDFIISFDHNSMSYVNQSIGIKSHIGSPPTLLNASSATNFIFEINNFVGNLDEINSINTRSKIKDRIDRIISSGGSLEFVSCENITHQNNLRNVDTMMPEYLSEILLSYYTGSGNKISDLVIMEQKKIRIKDYLKSVALGMFSNTEWDGNYSSEGYIIVKEEGDMALYHVIRDSVLKDYLFQNSKLDTPSSTRHRFGNVYREGNRHFIKLNLQIRFI